MRTALVCLVVLLVPPAALFAYKQYQAAQDQTPAMPASTRAARGEVLFFNATWCGPCRQMKPIVAQLKREGYHLRDVDVDSNRAMAQKYGIRGIPTFVFLQNGKEVHRFSGGTSPSNLKRLCSNKVYH
jgi:thioredoxin 1